MAEADCRKARMFVGAQSTATSTQDQGDDVHQVDDGAVGFSKIVVARAFPASAGRPAAAPSGKP
eukprot:12932129-Prorocentrum_lima.AAC.1